MYRNKIVVHIHIGLHVRTLTHVVAYIVYRPYMYYVMNIKKASRIYIYIWKKIYGVVYNSLETVFVRVVNFRGWWRRRLLRYRRRLMVERLIGEAAIAAAPQAKVSRVGHA